MGMNHGSKASFLIIKHFSIQIFSTKCAGGEKVQNSQSSSSLTLNSDMMRQLERFHLSGVKQGWEGNFQIRLRLMFLGVRDLFNAQAMTIDYGRGGYIQLCLKSWHPWLHF